MMSTPIQILKIPFIDFTPSIESFAPSGMFALWTDFGLILQGFVLPFPIIISEFAAAMFTQFILNPRFLYPLEILHQWRPGLDMRGVKLFNDLDFWLSFNMGKSFSFAAVGLAASIPIMLSIRQSRQQEAAGRGSLATPPGRGDFPIWLMGGLWVLSMVVYVWIVHRWYQTSPFRSSLALPFCTPLCTPISTHEHLGC